MTQPLREDVKYVKLSTGPLNDGRKLRMAEAGGTGFRQTVGQDTDVDFKISMGRYMMFLIVLNYSLQWTGILYALSIDAELNKPE